MIVSLRHLPSVNNPPPLNESGVILTPNHKHTEIAPKHDERTKDAYIYHCHVPSPNNHSLIFMLILTWTSRTSLDWTGLLEQ